jgi:CubicO group peptidase (beta-lactamase class C family)
MSATGSWRRAFDAGSVPGMAVGVVHGGTIRVETFGHRSASGPAPVGDATVFDAASLTKPLVAYATMRLVEAGALSLDDRAAALAPCAMADEVDAAPITVRHLLSHRSGLPNPFGVHALAPGFAPGARFGYSSVGFAYLQRVIEAVAGEPLEATLRRLVLEPLGMKRSSLIWQRRFEDDHARPHERGVPLDKHRPPVAAASYSLQTTAGDYARFVAATIDGGALAAATHRAWLEPCVDVPKGRAEHDPDAADVPEPGVAWSLGWGVEPGAGTFFQWGKTRGIRAFAMGSVAARAGVVVLANGETGLRAVVPIVAKVLPGDHPAIGWVRACVTE